MEEHIRKAIEHILDKRIAKLIRELPAPNFTPGLPPRIREELALLRQEQEQGDATRHGSQTESTDPNLNPR